MNAIEFEKKFSKVMVLKDKTMVPMTNKSVEDIDGWDDGLVTVWKNGAKVKAMYNGKDLGKTLYEERYEFPEKLQSLYDGSWKGSWKLNGKHCDRTYPQPIAQYINQS